MCLWHNSGRRFVVEDFLKGEKMRTDGYIVPAGLWQAFQAVRKRKSYTWTLHWGVYGDILVSGISGGLFRCWMKKAREIKEAWHEAVNVN